MGSIIGDVAGSVLGSVVGGATGSSGSNGGSSAAAAKTDLAKANSLNSSQITAAQTALTAANATQTAWNSVYGSLQTNLGNYYNSLTADKLSSMGLQAQQTQYQAAVQQIKSDAAARGIGNSGAEFEAESDANFSNASTRAAIVANAPQQVATAQQSFLQLGLSTEPAVLGAVSNANSNLNLAYSAGVSANSGVATAAQNGANTLANTSLNNQNEIAGSIAGSSSGALGDLASEAISSFF